LVVIEPRDDDKIRTTMATLHSIHTQRLVSLARRFQITRADEAAGHCLSLSLDFALVAKHLHDIDVDLVKWTVADDPAYVDHWAVILHGDTVIDLTRVQVDGATHLTAAMADYPANFRSPRIYPASLLAKPYTDSRTQDNARLSNRFLWTCGTRLLAFDLKAAARHRDARHALLALREGRTFLGLFMLGCLTRALENRARKLMSRLHAQPDMASLVKREERWLPSSPSEPMPLWSSSVHG